MLFLSQNYELTSGFFLLLRYKYSILLLITLAFWNRWKSTKTWEQSCNIEFVGVRLCLRSCQFTVCLLKVPQGYWKLYIWNVGNKSFECLKKTSFAYAHPEKKQEFVCKVQLRGEHAPFTRVFIIGQTRL